MANLTDADKVIRNDVGKTIASKLDDIADAIVQHGGGAESLGQLSDVDIDTTTLAEGQSIVYNETTQKFENGQVSTVGGLNDLNDVTIDDTSLEEGQELVYNNTAEVFENKTTRVELTQAEYDALANPLPDVDYYITDAPSMSGSSKELSYDGGTASVYDKVEGLTAGDIALGNTTPSGSTAAAINTNKNNIGTLSNLTTTNKTSLVNAINEVNNSSLKLSAGTGSGSGTSYSFPTGGSTNGSWLVTWGGAYVGFVTIFSTTVKITKIAGSTELTATATVSGNNCNISLSGIPYNALKYSKLF